MPRPSELDPTTFHWFARLTELVQKAMNDNANILNKIHEISGVYRDHYEIWQNDKLKAQHGTREDSPPEPTDVAKIDTPAFTAGNWMKGHPFTLKMQGRLFFVTQDDEGFLRRNGIREIRGPNLTVNLGEKKT